MARKIVDADGATWEVAPTGRHTQYGSDELSLEFRRTMGGIPEHRFARFSPQGAKSAEMALEEISDRALVTLLGTAQPAWTSPDAGYGLSA
ncbi:MAG: hypothetical protein ABIZ70_06075 [Gemmatimonadales bacterium]